MDCLGLRDSLTIQSSIPIYPHPMQHGLYWGQDLLIYWLEPAVVVEDLYWVHKKKDLSRAPSLARGSI